MFIWNYEEYDFFYDIGEEIRFKVRGVEFPEDEPGRMVITGIANSPGLGLIKWWLP